MEMPCKSKSDYQYCPDHQTTREASRALGSSVNKVLDPEGGTEDDVAVPEEVDPRTSKKPGMGL